MGHPDRRDPLLTASRAAHKQRSSPGRIVRRERLSASTGGRREPTMRICTPAEVRPGPPPTHPREASPHPDGRAGPVVPKSGDADPARPRRKRRGPRETDRDHASLPRARALTQPPRDASTLQRAPSRRAARVHGSERRTLTPLFLRRRGPSRPSADASRFFSTHPVRLRRTARPTTAGCRSTATRTTSRA